MKAYRFWHTLETLGITTFGINEQFNFYEATHLKFEGMLAYAVLRLRFVNTIYMAAHYVRYGYILLEGYIEHSPFTRIQLSEMIEFISDGYY